MSIKKIAVLMTAAVTVSSFAITPSKAGAQEVSDNAVSVITEEIAVSNATGSAVVSETVTKAKVVNKKATTAKQKKAAKKKSYKKSELRLMASIILCEAGGECYQGKLAVGIVVMNRVKSSAFPNTVRGVIYQKRQFSPVREGKMKRTLAQYDAGKTKTAQWKACISAAKKVLQGQRTVRYRGKTKNMRSFLFFSVKLAGARFRLGGHRFK